MQIEQSFRDLKSHHYGSAFEDSLTRRGTRLDILLLIHALASFASWLAGMACEATGIDCWLSPIKTRRRLYSTMRVGRVAVGTLLAGRTNVRLARSTARATARRARTNAGISV
jgi:hypothetical protein